MGTPFIGEMRYIGFGFAPKYWAACDGQTLPIAQNQTLFSLLGNTWGGDGRATFKLPDFRGRVPVGPGGPVGAPLGGIGGEELHTLINPEVPSHKHTAQASAATNGVAGPAGNILASTGTFFGDPANLVALHPQTITPVGGTGHENRQPYTVVNLVIALWGTFPSRN